MSVKNILQKALSIFGYRLTRLSNELTLGLDIIEQKRRIEGHDATSTSPQGDLEKWFRKDRAVKIHKWTHYFGIYERHLAPLRGKPVRVLEIGVYKGGSLEMWKSYFGGELTIVGLDIDPACKQFENVDAKIHVQIGDQETSGFRGDSALSTLLSTMAGIRRVNKFNLSFGCISLR